MIENIKKYVIKIPDFVKVYYNRKNSFLIFKTSTKQLKIKLESCIFIFQNKLENETFIYVSPFLVKSQDILKNKGVVQSNETSKIKKVLFESFKYACRKLKLVGIGYKMFLIENKKGSFLHLKLGLSHSIYLKIPEKLKLQIHSNNLIISGNSLKTVEVFTSMVKSYKKPDPYKGKGFLYVNETIKLKIGKKV